MNSTQQNHPHTHTYFDFYQGDPAKEPPTYTMVRLRTCYQFEPVAEGIDPLLILGGQGNLWTESIPTFRHAEYMLWPGFFALAEVLWSPKEKWNWEDFLQRTDYHLQRLEQADINFARNFNDVIIPTKVDIIKLQICQPKSELSELFFKFILKFSTL